MMRSATKWSSVAASVTILACLAPATVMADRWEVRQEAREGYYAVEREKREARREIRRELREDYYRDQYYRGDERWYRDGRYWSRDDYERRYYRRRDKDDDEFLKGAVVGAAVVGLGVAIAKSNDD